LTKNPSNAIYKVSTLNSHTLLSMLMMTAIKSRWNVKKIIKLPELQLFKLNNAYLSLFVLLPNTFREWN